MSDEPIKMHDLDIDLLHGEFCQQPIIARNQTVPFKSKLGITMINWDDGKLWRDVRQFCKFRSEKRCDWCKRDDTDVLYAPHKEIEYFYVHCPMSRSGDFPVEVLARLFWLCYDCHINIAHIDRPDVNTLTGKIVKDGNANIEKMCKLNNWNKRVCKQYIGQKSELKRLRDNLSAFAVWRQDWTLLETLKITKKVPDQFRALKSLKGMNSVRILKAWWLPRYVEIIGSCQNLGV